MRPRRLSARFVVLVPAALALLVASCGSTDLPDGSGAPTSGAVTTSTAATTLPATTTVPETSALPATTDVPVTTTLPAASTSAASTEVPATTTAPPSTTTVDVTALAEGSGCTPGTDTLPDGEWFGYVTDTAPDAVTFDLACWFTGDAAALAAAEDGEESPPPNDYYIRNRSSRLRTVPVAGALDPRSTRVSWLADTGGPDLVDGTYAEWRTVRAGRTGYQPGVWITVSGGVATAITEQYQP